MCRRTLHVAFIALVLLIGTSGALADGVWEGQIDDGNDDVEQQTSMYMDSSDLELVDDGNTHVGLRFLNVTVPAGSAITSAYIEFQVDEVEGDEPADLIIYGDLSPDAPAFDSGDTTNVSDRPATAAQAMWSPEHWPTAGEKHQSADISSVIEEIVNQPGWRSGNALVLIIYDDPDSTATGFRTAESYEGDSTGAALLHIEYGPAVKAKQPGPAYGETDVLRDSDLSWLPGAFAAAHDVYFGTNLDDVNAASRANPLDVLISQGQTAATLELDRLEFGQTYYWRVDEVNSAPDSSIFKGDVWSFTVEPFTYPVQNIVATAFASDPGSGPENMVNGSGLNANDEHSTASTDMWSGTLTDAGPVWVQFEFDMVYKLYEMLVWNYNVQFEAILGFGLNEVTVEYSENGTDWTTLGDLVIAQATSSPDYTANTVIDFAGVAAKFVRLTVNSNHGMLPQYGLSEVRFMYVPVNARNPVPAAGATEVAVDAVLGWRAGREADTHEVFLSTDEAAVADDTALIDTTGATTVDPGALDLAATYYWKVSEVNEAEAIGMWDGAIWSFSTEEYVVVDDFESYDDDQNRIYETWLDGFVNDTGSTVGHLESPFAEQTIVRSGAQSMPLFYEGMSEAELELAQDWTASGIKSLSLYFYGDPDNTSGQLYVKINGTKVLYDGSPVNMTQPTWHHWNIDLAATGANLNNVTQLTIGIEGAGAQGTLFIDDIRLYPEVLDYLRLPDITAPGDTLVGVPNDDDWPTGEEPPNAIDDDATTKFLHRKGGAMPTGIQVTPSAGPTIVTGLTFTTANDVPTRDPVSYELYGSNGTIDGPYELIAAGDIVDFAGETEWPRFTVNDTVIKFDNEVAYSHYQIVFPTLRGETETLMQIAEIELIGTPAN